MGTFGSPVLLMNLYCTTCGYIDEFGFQMGGGDECPNGCGPLAYMEQDDIDQHRTDHMMEDEHVEDASADGWDEPENEWEDDF